MDILSGNIRYYFELFLERWLVVIVPALVVFTIGAVIVFALPRSYYAEGRVILAAPQTGAESTEEENSGWQSPEQRVLTRESLLGVARRFALFPELQSTLSNTKLAEVLLNHITLRKDSNTGTMSFFVGFKYDDAALAAKVAAELMEMIIEARARAQEATQLHQRLAGLQAELSQRMLVYTEKHPTVRDLKAKIAMIEATAAEGLQAAYPPEISRIRQMEAAQVQLLETPEVPRYPMAPRRLKLLMLVAAVSALSGMAGLYIADRLGRSIRGAFDLADALSGQTLVMVPRWTPKLDPATHLRMWRVSHKASDRPLRS